MTISRAEFLRKPIIPYDIDDILGNFIMKRDPKLAFSWDDLSSDIVKYREMSKLPITKSMLKDALKKLVKKQRIVDKLIIVDNEEPATYYMLK